MKNTREAGGGVGFLGFLTLVFIVLKLTEVIDWSWWWVLAPLWGPLAIGLAAVTFWFAVIGIIALWTTVITNRKRTSDK